MSLTEVQREILKEAFNIGAGRAATALEDLMGRKQELHLAVPDVIEKRVSELHEEITAAIGDNLCGVVESFGGAAEGTAVLLYSQRESLELVKLLLGEDLPVEDLPTLQSEALLETSNIVLDACLSGMADMLQEQLTTQLPVLRRGSCLEILQSAGYSADDTILYLRMKFSLTEDDLCGHIGFSMNVNGQGGRIECLDRFASQAFGS